MIGCECQSPVEIPPEDVRAANELLERGQAIFGLGVEEAGAAPAEVIRLAEARQEARGAEDYGRADEYVTLDNETGVEMSAIVKAHMSPKTQGYHNPRSYQLISAGQDGIFGNDDDITNFDRERAVKE